MGSEIFNSECIRKTFVGQALLGPLGAHSASMDSLVGSGEEPTDRQRIEKQGKGREEATGKGGGRDKGTRLHFFFPLPALTESFMRSRIESICELPVDVHRLYLRLRNAHVLFLLHYHAECIVNIFIVFNCVAYFCIRSRVGQEICV